MCQWQKHISNITFVLCWLHQIWLALDILVVVRGSHICCRWLLVHFTYGWTVFLRRQTDRGVGCQLNDGPQRAGIAGHIPTTVCCNKSASVAGKTTTTRRQGFTHSAAATSPAGTCGPGDEINRRRRWQQFYYRASACASVQNAILLHQFCLPSAECYFCFETVVDTSTFSPSGIASTLPSYRELLDSNRKGANFGLKTQWECWTANNP